MSMYENEIYSFIQKEKLEDVLENLQALLGFPVQLIDLNGDALLSFGKPVRYCSLFRKNIFKENKCRFFHRQAGEQARIMGQAYIFACGAGLNHIAFPILHSDRLLGSIIIGPFLFDTPDSTILSEAALKYDIEPEMLLDLYDELSGLKIIPPKKVNNLKKILEYMLLPLIPSELTLMQDKRQKLYQQSKINETIQRYKGKEAEDYWNQWFLRERELLLKAKTGDVKETKRILNDLLGQVFFSRGATLDVVQTRSVELATLLSRIAIEGGARAGSVYDMNMHYINQLSEAKSIENVCYLLQEILENFMLSMFYAKDGGNACMRKAFQYIATHYNEHLTLSVVAKEAGLSESYFSLLFKKSAGMSFRDYICKVRVEESKELLRSTNESIADIAVAVGFPDQSYYSKVFKKLTGMTPAGFRR